MKLALLVIPTVCYLLEAALMLKDDKAGALTFMAYGVANIGLLCKFVL